MKQKYQAALYLRVSKEDEAVAIGTKNKSDSIANQKSLLLDFVKNRQDIQVVSIREDDGYSGVNFNRPAFQAMIEDIKRGTIDCIIVKDLSRFGRNYIEVGCYLEKLFPVLGIRFIAVNDNYDSLYTDSAYDIILPFKNLINEAYCRDLSIKIRSCLDSKRKNGEFVGAFACYGYIKNPENKHQLMIDWYAGSIVQDIFRMKLHGYSIYSIAEQLNAQGILSPLEYKRSMGQAFTTCFQTHTKAIWSAKAVMRILTNEVYTGTLVQGKQTTPNHKNNIRQPIAKNDWIRIQHTHDALIEPYLFELIQTLMQRDTRTSPHTDVVFPLAGLLYCGDCGQPMVRKTTSYHNKKDGNGIKKYAYYVCHGHANTKKCSWHRIKEKDLLIAVLQAINFYIGMISDKEKALHNMPNLQNKQIQKYERYIEEKQQELEKIQRFKLGMYEDFKEGLLSQSDYFTFQQEFDNRIQQAIDAMHHFRTQITKIQNYFVRENTWVQQFIQCDELSELTRCAAVVMIHRILIYEGNRIKIIFRFCNPFTGEGVYCPEKNDSIQRKY